MITFFRPLHYFIGGVFLIGLVSPAFWRRMIPIYQRDWGALLLLLFCVYFFYRAASYPLAEVSQTYKKIAFSRIGAGILLGFFVLSAVHEGSGRTRRCRTRFDLLALAIAVAALIWISYRLFLRARSDIFLIEINSGSQSFYQDFGNYLLLWYICVVVLLRRWASSRWGIFRAPACVGMLLSLTVWTSLLSQVVGSNNATASILAIGVITAFGDFFMHLRWNQGWKRWVGGSILFGEGVLSCVVVAALLVNLPPLRIFNFQPVYHLAGSQDQESQQQGPQWQEPVDDWWLPSLSVSNSSLTSRVKIFSDVGRDQILVNPLFGDLGAEIVTGSRGNYLHSVFSIQTHTGLIGSLLLSGFLLSRVKSLTKVIRYYDFAVCVVIGVTFTMAVAATFFLWLPFWFVIGLLLVIPTYERSLMPIKCDLRGAQPKVGH